MIKRLFDLLFSFLFILLLLPLFLVVSVLIILDDGWPVFFVQQRVGLKGKMFRMYKFRTMTVALGASKGSFDAGSSSRVTRFGKYLRKSKLDELPQMLNVLRGEMAIVGPRPEVQKWVMKYPERWAIVHSVKPGITDNAAIVFRNEEAILSASHDPEKTYFEDVLPQKLDLYENYTKNNSFKNDIIIIWNTIIAVLFK
jgi:lipopolysaccharide/colanic/teichoic acid biosynthesis glycosyltransferase